MKFFIWPIIWLKKMIIYKIFRLKTRGVRVMLIDRANANRANAETKILLVRHRYNNYWVFPGGGIKSGEPADVAAIRETMEEVNIKITEPLLKLGEYKNLTGGKNDEVTMFIAENWLDVSDQKSRRFVDFLEIAEKKWFSVSELPPVSGPTKNRISEMLAGKTEIRADW